MPRKRLACWKNRGWEPPSVVGQLLALEWEEVPAGETCHLTTPPNGDNRELKKRKPALLDSSPHRGSSNSSNHNNNHNPHNLRHNNNNNPSELLGYPQQARPRKASAPSRPRDYHPAVVFSRAKVQEPVRARQDLKMPSHMPSSAGRPYRRTGKV